MSDIDRVPHTTLRFFGLYFSDVAGMTDVMRLIEGTDLSSASQFRYVVTPNADHIVRVVETPALRDIYNRAWLCLNDSRVIQLLLRVGRLDLPVVRGSDLAVQILTSPWIRNKRVIVIGGDERVSRWLASLSNPDIVFHYNPPMGFIRSEQEVDNAIDFIKCRLPAVVFLAVGSPGQEIVADTCVRRGLRSGIAFCVGAGILMAAGIERRAPIAVRSVGLEWFYRLARDPRRLAGRYLRDVRILPIVGKEIMARWSRSSEQDQARIPSRPQ